MAKIDIIRNVPRLGLSRTEVALAIGVAPNTVDEMVREGMLPRPRRWHTRKFWRIAELEAAMAEWPVDGEQEVDVSNWRASA
ncbi:hypothetical protein [Phyllobacterium lublinensis]|uniref:hypothetical protein n=1 Tax=Phyllobacterium lublinensis TaxID=2875708 RepID=UPI001CCC4131|nr:hypothetical protein [Phyllobacterium sp. 2063]MBZ9653503.1 hypothetical protein [Phyllobacterium sp. 2063]